MSHEKSHPGAHPRPARRARLQPMTARDPHESHRVSTPLELLYDLCFVVAVAQASAHLHHGLAEGHYRHALLAFGLVFFAIWWAWMNFTWFASAYDVDDVPYRLTVLLQIAGVLVIAAGVPRAFDRQEFSIVTAGYAIMRIGLIAQWLRAARGDPARRRTALRFALGVTVCEVGWLSLQVVPAEHWLTGWCVLAPAELLVPVWAERASPTVWHPHHIAERYGLLTLIVLGESVLSATVAIQSSLDAGHLSLELGALIAGSILLLFSLWWIYFDEPVQDVLVSTRAAFVWGYGHVFIFAALAAVGAGIAVSADFATGHAHVPAWAAGAAVTVPVSVFVLGVWALHVRPLRRGPAPTVACLSTTALILGATVSDEAVLFTGLLLSLLVGVLIATRPAPA